MKKLNVVILSNSKEFLDNTINAIGYKEFLNFMIFTETLEYPNSSNITIAKAETIKCIVINTLVIDDSMMHYRDIFKKFLKKININVATPCYGGQMFVNYTTSLLMSIDTLRQFGIIIKPTFISNESLITRGRNLLVAKFMAHEENDYLLFIDSDVGWKPEEILKLVVANKPIVGGLYPKKRYNWDKLPTTEKHKLLDYVVNFRPEKIIESDKLLAVKHMGTGFMMISRQLLTQLFSKHPERKYTDDTGSLNEHEAKFCYTLFDCKIHQGHYLSEDYLFCLLVSELGYNVFVDVTINLSHTGMHTFEGNFVSSFK